MSGFLCYNSEGNFAREVYNTRKLPIAYLFHISGMSCSKEKDLSSPLSAPSLCTAPSPRTTPSPVLHISPNDVTSDASPSFQAAVQMYKNNTQSMKPSKQWMYMIGSNEIVSFVGLLSREYSDLKLAIKTNIRTRIVGGQWRHKITIYGNILSVYIHIWKIRDVPNRQLLTRGY